MSMQKWRSELSVCSSQTLFCQATYSICTSKFNSFILPCSLQGLLWVEIQLMPNPLTPLTAACSVCENIAKYLLGDRVGTTTVSREIVKLRKARNSRLKVVYCENAANSRKRKNRLVRRFKEKKFIAILETYNLSFNI